ncbi:MAG: hypothetical protein B6D59_01000 [Campylobacteraceae bacterium 4484_4]|nr:MAG: hypothetical protein B6D59_01000 [Campylobacteraceae bacterium 4484_4]
MAEAQASTPETLPKGAGYTLHTHKSILQNHGYELLALFQGHAKIRFKAGSGEILPSRKTLYEGSIFTCANFAAIAAVNIEEMFVISAKNAFLNPIKEDEEVIFEANVTTNSSGKKEVSVKGSVNDLEVYQGEFVLMKLDERSILQTKTPKEAVEA